MVTPTERYAQFVSALVKVQSVLTATRVSSSSFWDVCIEPLSTNGLSLSQTIEMREGKAIVITVLRHTGGHEDKHSIEVKPTKDGRIGPLIELYAFNNLLGILGLSPPNEDPDTNVFVPVDDT